MSTRTPRELGVYAREWAAERLTPFAMQTAPGRYGDAPFEERVRLASFGLATMLECPAKVTVPAPFEWDIFKATRWLGARALHRYLSDETVTTIRQAVVTTMSEAIRSATDESTYVDAWIRTQTRACRALLAARAGGWVASLVETVREHDPEAEALRPPPVDGPPVRFYMPDNALIVEPRIDALYGRRATRTASSETVLTVVGKVEAAEDLICFEALAVTIATGVAPGFVAAVMPRIGRVRKVAVTVAVIERGLDMAVRLAELEVRAIGEGGAVGIERRPSYFGCRSCSLFETCEERATADLAPVIYGGLQARPQP